MTPWFMGALIALQIGAAGAFIFDGNAWKAIYWTAATLITVAVWNI